MIYFKIKRKVKTIWIQRLVGKLNWIGFKRVRKNQKLEIRWAISKIKYYQLGLPVSAQGLKKNQTKLITTINNLALNFFSSSDEEADMALQKNNIG